MLSGFIIVAGVLCLLCGFVHGSDGSSAPSPSWLYPTHPHAIYHRQAQEIVMTFISQLNANKANATQLKGLLNSIPDETVKVFQLAGMTLSTGNEDEINTSHDQQINKKPPSTILSTYPTLHMLLNQFMLSTNPIDKQQFLELFELSMNHGADPSISLNNDPPLYIKGIMIKEMELVKTIIEHSHKSITNEIIARSSKISRLLKMIYAMPAEVVPLAKLLLHVEKLTHKYHESLPYEVQESFNGTEVAIRLLLGAKLDRPTLSANQLLKYSSTYNQTIQHLTSYLLPENQLWNIPGQLETSKIISTLDIAQIMNELLVIIPQALIESIFWLPNDRKEVAIEHFFDIHIIPDEVDRNCFHYLAAANSVKMMEMLMTMFDRMIAEQQEYQHEGKSSEEGEKREGASSITTTTATNPIGGISEKKIRHMAETLLNSLSQVDHRGHTPLSYAEVRYGPQSPISMTFKDFISRLIRIFEGDFSLPFSGDVEEDKLANDLQEMEDILGDMHDGAVETEEVAMEVDIQGSIDISASEGKESDHDIDSNNIGESNTDIEQRRELPESDAGGWNPERLTIFDEIVSTDDSSAPSVLDEDVNDSSSSSSTSSSKQFYAPCDILEIWDVDNLPNVDEFFVRYINTATPVVFRGAALKKSSQMYKLRQKFAKKKFVRNYGTVQVTASTLPYADSFGVQSSIKLMKDVANSDQVVTSGKDASERVSVPLYTFTTASAQWSQKLNKDVPFPEPILAKESSGSDGTKASPSGEKKAAYSHELQFYLGPAGTGAPVHFHGHAINTLAYGEKKWVLYPPSEGFYTTIAALDFFKMLSTYDHEKSLNSLTSNHTVNEHIADLRKGALQCTQYAGDIMYVPTMWAHGTLNTKQSIGVAHEFSVESFCME